MSLHNEIMNLQIPLEIDKGAITDSGGIHIAYKLGHLDARHRAAEKAIKYDALVERIKEVQVGLGSASEEDLAMDMVDICIMLGDIENE